MTQPLVSCIMPTRGRPGFVSQAIACFLRQNYRNRELLICFADLREVTYQPADPVEGVARLVFDSELRDLLVGSAREYCHHHTWRRVADEYARVWDAVER